MFSKHLIVDNQKEEVLYLFIDYNFEFSKEFGKKNRNERQKNIFQQVNNYLKDHKIDFKGSKVFLVVNGIIIGTLLMTNYNYNGLRADIEPKYKYVEYINVTEQPKPDNPVIVKTDDTVVVKENNSIIVRQNPDAEVKSEANQQNSRPENTMTPNRNAPQPEVYPPNNQPTEPISPPPTPVKEEIMVTVYRSNGTINELMLEDYIVGVVSAEMPAAFHSEALKAQAVAARTYALKRIDQRLVLTDTDNHQIYKDINQLKAYWGNGFDTYYNKVKNSVMSTKGEYIAYNGNYIDAVYHSTSNGQTEDSVAVWGNSYPYLKSIDSHWDLDAPSYLRETVKENNVISSILGINFDVETPIEVLSRTPGGRIENVRIGSTIFNGIQLRELLGLRSADFDIAINENNTTFITRGYGHGVGMSQYGANGMAKEGYNYNQILSHYYPGTSIRKI